MKRGQIKLGIFCLLCVGFWVFPLSGNTQSKSPSFENLKARNVGLAMSGFMFTSGVNGQGQVATCAGLEVKEANWQGSGFIVRPDGTIVTNFHVASKSLGGVAKFDNGSKYDIREIKVYDPINDLAILKIAGNRQFPTVTLGNSDAVRPLDSVIAVGNSRGQGINVTKGETSQLVKDDNNRIIMLRHTAAIAPGNSGGALYKGQEVVGVNVATWPGTQFHQAVPINLVRPLLTYNQSMPLKDVFLPTLETLTKKAKQIHAQNGTVPAATDDDHPGVVTIPFNFYPLNDVIFVLQAEQGQNLSVLIADARGSYLGCDRGANSTAALIVSTPENPQQVGIYIVNSASRPVNFGLSVLNILW